MKVRRLRSIAGGAGVTLVGAAISVLVVTQDASGKGAATDTCGPSLQDRVAIGKVLDDVSAQRVAGNGAGTQLKSVESRLRLQILAVQDDDVRQRLQDLFDDLSAARAAIASDADQAPELTSVLRNRLGAFARRC
jgi:hypothetical protein